MWQWDVDNDICAICRIIILEPCLNVSRSILSQLTLTLYSARPMRGKATNAPLSGVNAATPFTTVVLLDGYYRYSYTIDHARC